MLVIFHLLFGLALSLALFPLYGWQVSIIFLANLLMDADHYAYYVLKFRSFNLLKARRYFIERTKPTLLPFHTVEFIIPVLLLSFCYPFFFFVTVGIAAHLLLDFTDEFKERYIGRFPSIVWYFLRKH